MFGINGSFLLFVRHPLESQEKVSKNKKIYAAAFLKYLPWVSSTSGLLCTFYIVCVNCPLFVYTEHCSRALELGFVILYETWHQGKQGHRNKNAEVAQI